VLKGMTMSATREWLRRLWGTLARKQRDRDLEEELRLHVELASEDLRRRGHSPDEALRLARLQLGGVPQVVEAIRDQGRLPWLDNLARDVRYGLRSLRRAPAFTAITVLTLSLGIGATTAIFSIVNGVILRPLGYPDPEKLMHLTTGYPALGVTGFGVSPPEYLEFRAITKSFASVGAYTTGQVNLTAGDRPIRARSASVDDRLLEALAIPPAQGRLFAQGETDVGGPPRAPGQPAPPAPPLAILSHELWQRAFAGAPLVGTTIEVDGRRHEIVGIMPPGADIMDNRTEIWLPLGLNPADRQNRGTHFLYLVGRLTGTAESARTELDALTRNWGARVGATDHVFIAAGPNAHFLEMRPVQEALVGAAGRSIWVLQAAVGLVLLIACVNVANLLLARAETRRRELAVRTSLGAGRGRLLQQFMTEGVLLSLAGGTAGLALARFGLDALIRAYPTALPRTNDVAIDPFVLLFTLSVSIATGLLFGLTPLIYTSAGNLAAMLKEGGKAATVPSRHRVRSGLIAAEVAMAVVLVAGAALLVRTVYNLTKADPGFDRSRLVTFSLTLPPAAYPDASDRVQMYQQVLARVRAQPGVQAASAMSGLPPNRPLDANYTRIANSTAPPEKPSETVDYYQHVLADYFETMGIPIVRGRSFQPTDATSSGLVAVVNEALAAKYWNGVNPIGQRLRPCCSEAIPWYTVIGVARDTKQGGVERNPGTEFYRFVEQTGSVPPFDTIHIVLRTTLPAASLARVVDSVVREIDRTVPVVGLRDMNDVFADAIRRPWLLAQLIGAFAVLALLLAAIGTYGVLSYLVAQRRREIGIRMALGAEGSTVVTQIMARGLALTASGIGLGLAAAAGLNRLIASLLFGVQPTDAATLVAVVVTILLVAAGACALPAWRASRLNPNLVLREE
jgi:predicted permease